jgi:hypothetical protein
MTADHELPILDGEVVDLDALLDPQTGHRALTCAEVLEIAARVEAASRPRRRWLRRLTSRN